MHRKTEETKRVVLEAMGAGGGREKEILRRGERDGEGGRRGEWRGKGEGMEREKREREARKRTKGDSPLGGTEKLENTEAGPASPLHNQRYRRERDPSLLTLVGK